MLKVGLTGGIASGKSTVCNMFSELHVPVIDADIIARQLTEPEQPCFQQIIEYFGEGYIQGNCQLNRKRLRQLVFSNPSAKRQLEAILHPQIREQLAYEASSFNTDYCILSIPLLIEANMTELVDEILVIDIEPELQLDRLCQRDGISQQEAQNIVVQQCSREQRNKFANKIITNNSTTEHLQEHIKQLDKYYRQLSQTKSKSCQPPHTHGE